MTGFLLSEQDADETFDVTEKADCVQFNVNTLRNDQIQARCITCMFSLPTRQTAGKRPENNRQINILDLSGPDADDLIEW